MQTIARARYVRTSPLKARIVADLVRGKRIEEALAILKFTPNRAARLIEKVIKSAVANAENNNRMDPDRLFISSLLIDDGPHWKRLRSAPQGRVNRVLKRTAHIMVGVEEGDFEVVKPTGRGTARPKPAAKAARPTSVAPEVKDEMKVEGDEAAVEATEQPVQEASAEQALEENATEEIKTEEQPEENK